MCWLAAKPTIKIQPHGNLQQSWFSRQVYEWTSSWKYSSFEQVHRSIYSRYFRHFHGTFGIALNPISDHTNACKYISRSFWGINDGIGCLRYSFEIWLHFNLAMESQLKLVIILLHCDFNKSYDLKKSFGTQKLNGFWILSSLQFITVKKSCHSQFEASNITNLDS